MYMYACITSPVAVCGVPARPGWCGEGDIFAGLPELFPGGCGAGTGHCGCRHHASQPLPPLRTGFGQPSFVSTHTMYMYMYILWEKCCEKNNVVCCLHVNTCKFQIIFNTCFIVSAKITLINVSHTSWKFTLSNWHLVQYIYIHVHTRILYMNNHILGSNCARTYYVTFTLLCCAESSHIKRE